MAVTVERLVADIEADPSGAVRGLKTFDTMVSAVARDRTADIGIDSGSAMASTVTLEAALDRAARDRTVNIDVDRDGAASGALAAVGAAASAAMGALGSVAGVAGQAGSSLASVASSAGGAGGALGSVASSAGGAGGSMASMASAAASMAFVIVGVGGALAAFAAVLSVLPGALMAAAAAAGALAASLAPLIGLLGAIPVGLAALGGGLASVLAVAIPVAGAYSAMDAAGKGAATQTANMAGRARDLAAAQRGLREAIIGVARAERELRDARKNMAKAPMEAAEALEEQHFAAAGAILAEKAAVLALMRAQDNLQDAQNAVGDAGARIIQQTDEFTGKVYDVAVQSEDASDRALELAESTLSVQQAELALQEARDDTGDQQRKLREMEKKGIKNSDVMVAARDRLQDAEFGIQRARDAVAAATDRVAEAQKRLSGATADTTAAMSNLNDAMNKLSPTGQRFVRFLKNEFVPAFDGVSKAAQDAMLPGVERGLRAFMTMIDSMKEGIADFSRTIGRNFGDFFEHWATPANEQRLTNMFKGINRVLDNVLKLAIPLSDVLVSITEAATPMVNMLTKRLGGGLTRLSKWMRSDEGKKKTTKFFNDAGKWTGKWIDLLKPISGIFGSIVEAATPLANKIMRKLTKYFGDLNDYLNTKKGKKNLKKYFDDAWPMIKKVGAIIGDILDLLFNSSKGGKKSGFYKALVEVEGMIPKVKKFFENLDASDIAADVIAVFDAGVGFINALNDSGTLKALGLLGDGLGAISRNSPWMPSVDAGDANNTTAVDKNGKPTEKKPDAKEWTNWDKFKEDLEIIGNGLKREFSLTKIKKDFQQKVREMGGVLQTEVDLWQARWGVYFADVRGVFSGIKDDAKKKWAEMTTAFKEEVAIWKERLSGLKSWAKGKWQGMKEDFMNKWAEFTGVIEDEIEIWKEKFTDFKEWLKELKPEFDMPELKMPDLDPGEGTGLPGKKWKGGSVKANTSYIVGEKGPEMFNPSTSGRIMPANPTRELMESNGSGISDEQLESILNRVLAKAKPNVDMEINNTEKVDPHHLSREIAWALA